jgi:hypothetical protein
VTVMSASISSSINPKRKRTPSPERYPTQRTPPERQPPQMTPPERAARPEKTHQWERNFQQTNRDGTFTDQHWHVDTPSTTKPALNWPKLSPCPTGYNHSSIPNAFALNIEMPSWLTQRIIPPYVLMTVRHYPSSPTPRICYPSTNAKCKCSATSN